MDKLKELLSPVRFVNYIEPTQDQLDKTDEHCTEGLRDIVVVGREELQKSIMEHGLSSPQAQMHYKTIYDIIVVIRARAKLN